jgi:hypothetical protein
MSPPGFEPGTPRFLLSSDLFFRPKHAFNDIKSFAWRAAQSRHSRLALYQTELRAHEKNYVLCFLNWLQAMKCRTPAPRAYWDRDPQNIRYSSPNWRPGISGLPSSQLQLDRRKGLMMLHPQRKQVNLFTPLPLQWHRTLLFCPRARGRGRRSCPLWCSGIRFPNHMLCRP